MKKRILIVDDSPFFLESLYDILAEQGFDVTTAESGEAAVSLLGATESGSDAEAYEPYDLLITDLVMPGLSGFELAEFVRNKNRTNKFMPVVMLTEKEITKEEARKAGCSAYIPKGNLQKVASMAKILLVR